MSVAAERLPITTTSTRGARVLLGLLFAMIVWLLVMQAAVERSVIPPIGIIQAVWLAVPAVLVARGFRHGPLVAAVMSGIVLLGAVAPLIDDLSSPGMTIIFFWNVVALPLVVAMFVAAVWVSWARRAARLNGVSELDVTSSR